LSILPSIFNYYKVILYDRIFRNSNQQK